MAVYLVGYDLHEGDDYGPLEKAIQNIAADWWHCLDSTWLIVHPGDSDKICRALIPSLLRKDDRLLVALLGKEDWTCTGFNQECSDWPTKRL
jgi:hypothetical protein